MCQALYDGKDNPNHEKNSNIRRHHYLSQNTYGEAYAHIMDE